MNLWPWPGLYQVYVKNHPSKGPLDIALCKTQIHYERTQIICNITERPQIDYNITDEMILIMFSINKFVILLCYYYLD